MILCKQKQCHSKLGRRCNQDPSLRPSNICQKTVECRYLSTVEWYWSRVMRRCIVCAQWLQLWWWGNLIWFFFSRNLMTLFSYCFAFLLHSSTRLQSGLGLLYLRTFKKYQGNIFFFYTLNSVFLVLNVHHPCGSSQSQLSLRNVNTNEHHS